MAHAILVAAYHLLARQTTYQDPGADYLRPPTCRAGPPPGHSNPGTPRLSRHPRTRSLSARIAAGGGFSEQSPFSVGSQGAWLVANSDRGLGPDVRIDAIDRELHRDRLEPDGRPRSYVAELDSLPDGVFVVLPDVVQALLVWRGSLAHWSPAGYGAPRPSPRGEQVRVQTPRSTVAAIAAGYVPGVHPSLADCDAAGAPLHAAVRPHQAD